MRTKLQSANVESSINTAEIIDDNNWEENLVYRFVQGDNEDNISVDEDVDSD